MPTQFRLTRADFKLFSNQKMRRIRGSYVTLGIISLPGGAQPKAACIISKKVARNATDRNRIKRRVREILRPLMTRIKQPVALVLYAHSTSNTATIEHLSEDINKLIRDNKLID